MRMVMSLEQMKMAVPGIKIVGRTFLKMDTNVDGQRWVVNPMMASLLSSDGQTVNGLRLNWKLNGEISGKRSSLMDLVHVKGRHGMYLQVVMILIFFQTRKALPPMHPSKFWSSVLQHSTKKRHLYCK